jgi:hypothetical protein
MHRMRNRKFESIPLQRRVCEPSVPECPAPYLIDSVRFVLSSIEIS